MNDERSLAKEITEGFEALKSMRNNEPVAWITKKGTKEMTTFTTEDRIDAEKLTQATIVITAKGNEVDVHTEGEGQALFIANLIVSMMDNEVKNANKNNQG